MASQGNNFENLASTNCLSPSVGGSVSSNSSSLGIGSVRSRVGIWISEEDDGGEDSEVDLKNLHTRHQTVPLLGAKTNDALPRGTLSTSDVDSKQRRSIMADIKGFFTFKRKASSMPSKQDENGENSDDENSDEPVFRGRRRATTLESKSSKKISIPSAIAQVQKGPDSVASPTKNLLSVGGKANALAMSIKKWKRQKTEKERKETIAVDKIHQLILDQSVERFQVELPRPLMLVVRKEAIDVVTKTSQMYRSLLGNKHKLSLEAEKHLKLLWQDYDETNY